MIRGPAIRHQAGGGKPRQNRSTQELGGSEVHQRDRQPTCSRGRPARWFAVNGRSPQPQRRSATAIPLPFPPSALGTGGTPSVTSLRPVRRPDLEVAQSGIRLGWPMVGFPPQSASQSALRVRILAAVCRAGLVSAQRSGPYGRGRTLWGQAVTAIWCDLPAAHRGQAESSVAMGDPGIDDSGSRWRNPSAPCAPAEGRSTLSGGVCGGWSANAGEPLDSPLEQGGTERSSRSLRKPVGGTRAGLRRPGGARRRRGRSQPRTFGILAGRRRVGAGPIGGG